MSDRPDWIDEMDTSMDLRAEVDRLANELREALGFLDDFLKWNRERKSPHYLAAIEQRDKAYDALEKLTALAHRTQGVVSEADQEARDEQHKREGVLDYDDLLP